MLFIEFPFLGRFAATADGGFDAVEFLFPYPHQIPDVSEPLQQHKPKLVLHKPPAGNWEASEGGIASLPGRVDEFEEGVGRAMEYATAATIVDNLRFAATAPKKEGIGLLVEPCCNNQEELGVDCAHPACRQPRPQRAGYRPDQLRVPAWLWGLHRLRVQTAHDDGRRPRVAASPPA